VRPSSNRIRFASSNPKVDLVVPMGDGPATPTAGASSWEVIERVEDKGITDRASIPPFQQDVPIHLDGYAQGNSVQRQLDDLMELRGAIFRVEGPVHKPHLRYVFGGEPDFGEVIRDDDGTLLRQRFTLRLMEYVPPGVIRRPGRGRRRAGIGQAQALTYRVVAGDTLARVAFKQYDGNWKRWPDIGRINGIRDPFVRLEPGRILKLP
jgi:nucleoid-associated protein YgaU